MVVRSEAKGNMGRGVLPRHLPSPDETPTLGSLRMVEKLLGMVPGGAATDGVGTGDGDFHDLALVMCPDCSNAGSNGPMTI